MESESLKPEILPGDFILIQTPGAIYKSIRKVLDASYDHMAVLLDKDTVLHISPPAIRKISSNVFLMKKRNPIIIRANLTNTQREAFVKSLENTLGYGYDYGVLFSLLGKKLYHEFTKNFNKDPFQIFQKDFIMKNSWSASRTVPYTICTDIFFSKMREISPEFNEMITTNQENLNYSYLGSFSPDDLLILSEKNPGMLKPIHCYPTEPIKILNPLQSLEFKDDEQFVESPSSSGINFKKLINIIDKVLFISNLKENLKQYKQGLFRMKNNIHIKSKREVFQSLKLVYLLYQMRKMLKASENKSLSLTQTRDILKQGLEIYLLLQDSDLNDLIKRSFSRSKL